MALDLNILAACEQKLCSIIDSQTDVQATIVTQLDFSLAVIKAQSRELAVFRMLEHSSASGELDAADLERFNSILSQTRKINEMNLDSFLSPEQKAAKEKMLSEVDEKFAAQEADSSNLQ